MLQHCSGLIRRISIERHFDIMGVCWLEIVETVPVCSSFYTIWNQRTTIAHDYCAWTWIGLCSRKIKCHVYTWLNYWTGRTGPLGTGAGTQGGHVSYFVFYSLYVAAAQCVFKLYGCLCNLFLLWFHIIFCVVPWTILSRMKFSCSFQATAFLR